MASKERSKKISMSIDEFTVNEVYWKLLKGDSIKDLPDDKYYYYYQRLNEKGENICIVAGVHKSELMKDAHGWRATDTLSHKGMSLMDSAIFVSSFIIYDDESIQNMYILWPFGKSIIVNLKAIDLGKLFDSDALIFPNMYTYEYRVNDFIKSLPEELRIDRNDPNYSDLIQHSLLNLFATRERVLIYPINYIKTSNSGIAIQSKGDQKDWVDKQSIESNLIGMIVSASPDAPWYKKGNEIVPFKPGSLCIYAKAHEAKITYDNFDFLMVSSFDVWCVMKEDENINKMIAAKTDLYSRMRKRMMSKEDQQKYLFHQQ